MSSILSQIPSQAQQLLNQISSLPGVAIDASSPLTHFVQQLLGSSDFSGALVQSGGQSRVVVLSIPTYQKIQSMLGYLPTMNNLIQVSKLVASAGAKQLYWNIMWMGIGTVLLAYGMHKIGQAVASQVVQIAVSTIVSTKKSAHQSSGARRYQAMALAGVCAIAYSMYKTYEIARGLQAMSV